MPPQSSRDRILWILTNSGGRMERSRLRRCAGMKLADLDFILGELAREGRNHFPGTKKKLKGQDPNAYFLPRRHDGGYQPGGYQASLFYQLP